MSNVKTQKRIAAEVLDIGLSRVWLNPDAADDISQAMTRDDIRELVKQGLVKEKPAQKATRAIAKKREAARKKRKGVGHGKRTGSANARKSDKEKWMQKVRSQRRFLKGLRDKETITDSQYRKYYLQVKGGRFSTLKNIKEFMKTEGVLK
jgi:large subunit ribosomal protein L19e